MGGDHAVATRVLGLVESVVGELEQEIDAIGGFIEGRDADGDGQSMGSLVGGPGVVFADAPADFFRAHRRLAKRTLGEDEGEFFATVAAGYVVGAHAAQKSLAGNG
jgi:hypothetical protein